MNSILSSPDPSGVPDSTASRAVISRSRLSWASTISSSLLGRTGQPPRGTKLRHCWACSATTASASYRLSTRAPGRSRLLASFVSLLRSQKLRSVPSAFRPSLGRTASSIESISRSKTAGWNTSSTLRRLDRTATWRDHSCTLWAIGKPHVSTVLWICSRMRGRRVSSNSTTRWYALMASSSLRRDAPYHAVSSGPMIYPPNCPRRTSFLPHSSSLPIIACAAEGFKRTCVEGCIGKADILARFSKVSKADTPHTAFVPWRSPR